MSTVATPTPVARHRTGSSLNPALGNVTTSSPNQDVEAGSKEVPTSAAVNDPLGPTATTTTAAPAAAPRSGNTKLLARIVKWLRHTWLDLLTITACLLATLAIYAWASPVFSHQFPYNKFIKQSAWGMKHSKPHLHEYVSTTESALTSFFIPAAVIVLMGLLFVREFVDLSAALIGLGYALATSTLFQVIIKVFVGGLRPYFLNACILDLPDQINGISIDSETESFWLNVKEHCLGGGRRLNNAQMSFPSGHASAAFAGFFFLALWLNGKFKVFGQGRRSGLSIRRRSTAGVMARGPATRGRIQHWKLFLFSLPLLVATILAACKVLDHSHHPEDVIAGALIGILFAYMAYRMVYRSVYDWQDNHIPQEKETEVNSEPANS